MSRLETAADKAYYHAIPKVSFREITDDKTLFQPAGVHSEQSRSYGFNDFSLFERPEHYMRYIESELAVQVEYDMDEQDQEWLDRVNAERKKDQSGAVTYEVFEIIMDKLEKEWFNLIKRIPQPASHLPVEDSRCAICDDGEGENSNAIVFCDGCNLAVHQDCYGVPYIPEGQWLCRKCTVSPENPVSCLFCPNEGGAFKQTSTGHWAHLLCAIWIPELGVGNAIYMEPVDGVENVPKNRWKLVCSLCKDKIGACIQCDNKSCFTAFHATCARQAGLLMSMKMMGADGHMRAYCEKHLPPDWKPRGLDEEFDAPDGDDDADGDFGEPAPRVRQRTASVGRIVTTKTARAHAKSYRPGPPIVPHIIVKTLLDYVGKVTVRRKKEFIERLCRYWSLKREARRGAPLLKRLHLEPWTASNAAKQQSEAEKMKKLEFLTMLRNDLEKVRMLAEQARKREREKLRAAQLIKDVVDKFIFPHYAALFIALQKIRAMDRNDVFLQPVNRAEVPDYFEVVKEPMCWALIEDKLERNVYHSIGEFQRDVNRVVDNAMLYNGKETVFHRMAARIKNNAEPILAELDALREQSRYTVDQADGDANDEADVDDLEPSQLLLRTLALPDGDEPSRDTLASLFAFEMEKPKIATPPPPKKERKPKLSAAQRHAEREARRASLAAVASSRTRAGRAVVDAFVHEAGIEPSPSPGPSSPRRSGRSGRRSDIHDPPPPASKTRAGPSRLRHQNHPKGDNDDTEDESAALRPLAKPQRGVAGLQSVRVLTDRERREREKGLDLLAADIGAQDQYARFNVGWILPEGSKRKRGERAESSRAPSAPAGPAQAGDHRKSVRPSPDLAGSSLSPAPEAIEAVSEAPMRKSTRGATSASPTKDGSNAEARRPAAKNGKRRRESEGPSNTNKRQKVEPSTSPVKPDVSWPSKSKKSKGNAADDDNFAFGMSVWAKAPSYPFFPAVIVDPAHDAVPANVAALRTDDEPWLVQFFDKMATWAWVSPTKMVALTGDADVDNKFLAAKNFRSTHLKKSCMAAYRLWRLTRKWKRSEATDATV